MKTTIKRKITVEHKGMFAIGEFDELISDEEAKKYLIEDIERKIPKDYPKFEYSCNECSSIRKPFRKILGVGGFASPNSINVYVCPDCNNHFDSNVFKIQKENYDFILQKRFSNGFFESTNYIDPRKR